MSRKLAAVVLYTLLRLLFSSLALPSPVDDCTDHHQEDREERDPDIEQRVHSIGTTGIGIFIGIIARNIR